jgi:beta-galactosidase
MQSNNGSESIQIRDGITCFDGRYAFLNSTDYPYFRDDRRNWADRLDKLKALGHDVVTCYLPWRHHEVEVDGIRRYDFDGETSPNRDVIGFLKLCQEKGLKVVAKPGPFIHAELNYGGLPNWVCPSFNPAIEAMEGASGKPFPWSGVQPKADGNGMEELPLPAPFDPIFLAEVERWLRTVTERVLAPFAAPDGPIVMIQPANEGIFSNYQRAPWAYDYSPSSRQLYAQFLQLTYGGLECYNRRHGTEWEAWAEIQPPRGWKRPLDLAGSLFYADWAAFQAYYMREILTRLRSWIAVDLPFVINANPPTDESFGVDAWLSRINPDDLPGIAYGFTSWIGVACKDFSVVDRYQVMIKRARGANLEENWGFSKLYEPEFAHASVCFYQTLLQVASGATGYNVYTGVEARHSSPDLDWMHPGGYPDSAPVDGEGRLTPKADTVRSLNGFFNRWGSEFLETRPVRPVAFGIYLPYAHSAVWVGEQEWEPAAALGIPNHGRTLRKFQQLCLTNRQDFDLVNLQVADAGRLLDYPTLVLASGRWMDRLTQEKLQEYLLKGGRLILVGELPQVDEDFQPTQLLAEIQAKAQLVRASEFYGWTAADWEKRAVPSPEIVALNPEASGSLIWHYTHPEKDLDYLFVFSGKEIHGPIEFQFAAHGRAHALGVTLPPLSAAVIRIHDGAVTDVLAKGKNEEMDAAVVAACSLDGKTLSASQPGDWVYPESK